MDWFHIFPHHILLYNHGNLFDAVFDDDDDDDDD
jgi:hypothetical protein